MTDPREVIEAAARAAIAQPHRKGDIADSIIAALAEAGCLLMPKDRSKYDCAMIESILEHARGLDPRGELAQMIVWNGIRQGLEEALDAAPTDHIPEQSRPGSAGE